MIIISHMLPLLGACVGGDALLQACGSSFVAAPDKSDCFRDSKQNFKRAKVGVSHHVGFMRPYGLFDVNAVVLSNWMTRFAFVDDIAHKLDYLGLNYYGQVTSLPLIVELIDVCLL